MTATIHASSSRKIYLLSDFHLGAPNYDASLEREKKVVAFLQTIEDSAAAIFIVGDIFVNSSNFFKNSPKFSVFILNFILIMRKI